MSDPNSDPRDPIAELDGTRPKRARVRNTPSDIVAIVLSAVWIIGLGAVMVSTTENGRPLETLRFVMTLLAIFLPVALIWVAATAAKSTQILREESARLQAAIDAMRQTYVDAQNAMGHGLQPSVETKLEEIAAAQRKTEDAIATFTSIRPDAPPQSPAALALAPAPEAPKEQTSLQLGTPVEELSAPVSTADFIKALNFPETAEDADGFRALRRALQDRQTSTLVRASQDLLTMLSHDGIYMDDLSPDRARPEIWRRFAKGERGRAIAGLGGIRDRTSLALTSARMREDPVFRDGVHTFLRRFDKIFAAFAETATDEDIVALSDTRTARAFMLVGRVTGTFT